MIEVKKPFVIKHSLNIQCTKQTDLVGNYVQKSNGESLLEIQDYIFLQVKFIKKTNFVKLVDSLKDLSLKDNGLNK